MNEELPSPRLASRILLLNSENRLLLMRALHPDGRHFWVAPGGGLDADESFEEAARRELFEETGQSLPVGPCVWTRRHACEWAGRQHEQVERFFVVRTLSEEVAPTKADDYITRHRWWSLSEIEASSDVFAPSRIAQFLSLILTGEIPNATIDCGT
jgi:ADP-ribose pyrophosphatase YjhB (NUDIX family)